MPQPTFPPLPFRPGERVCVAVSGGGDSTALFLMLWEANTRKRAPLGIGLSAVHVNHALRGEESDGDQEFVERLCTRLEIPLVVERVDTERRMVSAGEGIEEAARGLRYEVFRSLLAGGRVEIVATAHTLDDQAETVLMKLLRGAWLEGLAGIAPVLAVPGGRILRPLLRVRRDELRAYLKAHQEPWREDGSNSDDAFRRSRLRQTVLPLLRQENPSIDRNLANLAELAREEEQRWAAELARVLPQLVLPGKPVRGGGRSNATTPGAQAVAIELERLRALDPALRRRVVRAAARQLGIRLNFAETGSLLLLCEMCAEPGADRAGTGKPRGVLRLAGGLVAERSFRELRLSIVPLPQK